MRIIAGTARGRRLKAPAGNTTRPTSDRVRESLFNILGQPPDDASVLDLFAGSGALGLEALSRGANTAVFVEENNIALQTLRENIEGLGLSKQSHVVRGDAIRNLHRLIREHRQFFWIFLDPPYATKLAEECLTAISQANMLAPGGQIVVEHDRRSEPGDTIGSLIRTDSRRYGDTAVSFYERNAA